MLAGLRAWDKLPALSEGAKVQVFNLDRKLVDDYESFARSFTDIRADDIRSQVDQIYANGQFWPEPLITINPRFETGAGIAELVRCGTLHPRTAEIFRIDGQPMTLHRHQAQAVAKAAAGQSFVVTTGTGSGKSLCFFIPIIDAVLRARETKEAARTRAIVVYPMNALANSQMKELDKFIKQSGLPPHLQPTFRRYTGQESETERAEVGQLKPDILLTNFMMLELLMTRQNRHDNEVMANAQGLEFIVLDELHTYRGRQGADVAMLVRRVRDRLCRDHPPICIGTSATMASEDQGAKNEVVAAVASRLFGAAVPPDAVIGESLQRATDQTITVAGLGRRLATAIAEPIPAMLTDEQLSVHPLAVWIEMEVGLQDGQSLTRRAPITLDAASSRLAAQTGDEPTRCRHQLQAMLMLMSLPAHARGSTGSGAFLAFKMHRFIAGAGHVYATLRGGGQRRATLDGQRFDPTDAGARLYPTYFCRNCGQEHHPVVLVNDAGVRRALPRSIDETPLDDPDVDEEAGYLMPEPENDPRFTFTGAPEDYPEEWTEPAGEGLRLRANRRKQAPRLIRVDETGAVGMGGRNMWFQPGKFQLCPACGDQPPSQAREINKLAGLSAEGRSSATTLLVSSMLRWLNGQPDIPQEKRKLLGFTDNRQDAALQAGHFNDFLFVSLLRAATLAAVRAAGPEGLSDEDFGRRIQAALGFAAVNRERRPEWMLDPEAKGPAVADAERILSRVLAHRVWADQRRGWRYTNPNLEELGLVAADYPGLDDLAADDDAFAAAPDEVRQALPETRRRVLSILFDALRRGLAITTDALDAQNIDATASAARQRLRDPWSIPQQETPRTAAALFLDPPKKEQAGVRGEAQILRGGSRSALARSINRVEIWGRRLSGKRYVEVMEAFLRAAEDYQMVRMVPTAFDKEGWRLVASAVRLVPGTARSDGRRVNPFFIALYRAMADALVDGGRGGGRGLFGLEGREHTAQVDQERREWREWRFRCEEDDLRKLAEARDRMRDAGEPSRFLPALFCSPTMELGVDISALNTVYLRNVPPTPANYAQRAGRAGRSGQPALVVTYCAAQSPHDRYYFADPVQMVSGVVRPPALDVANRDLLEAHLHAVWLAESGQELSPDIPNVLDLTRPGLPVRDDCAAALRDPALTQRAARVMRRILASIEDELTPASAPWAADRDGYAAMVAASAYERFARAFDRWRELYDGARAQLIAANQRSEMHGLSASERRQAKTQQVQANEQIALLERGREANGSDFYTYRYLATEGFLPGYNFPRLPLYAFVPSVGAGGAKPTYLQRARFLAIAEFGPRSLIYHEGRAYRVCKAKLPAGAHVADTGLLATTKLWVCDDCGAAHDHEPERCHVCGAAMCAVDAINDILRIDNVETAAAERITANDEDRQRQGFEIQTVFAWPERDGMLDVRTAVASDAEGPILRLDYASGTTISRINKGLRRRKEKSILGFGIDPTTGRWGKVDDEAASDMDPDIGGRTQRVVPFVQDNKNAALLRLAAGPLAEIGMATLQHALMRGLELVFQLEEGETQGEPVPSRDNRRAVLAYEASEGGAGVLGRLASEPEALARVARAALGLMHYTNIDAAAAASDPAVLQEDPAAQCVSGCYRCLLSYYNQPDHELIDRQDEDVKRILLRLVRARVTVRERMAGTGDPWRQALARWGLRAPDDTPLPVAGIALPLVWRSELVAAHVGDSSPDLRAAVEALGFVLVDLPSEPGDRPPSNLLDLLRPIS